jgi:hypothetical protein
VQLREAACTQAFNDRARALGRVVIDDDDFVVEAGWRLLPSEAFESGPEKARDCGY